MSLLSHTERQELIDLLLRLPNVQDKAARQLLLADLPAGLQNTIPADDTPQIHIASIVTTVSGDAWARLPDGTIPLLTVLDNAIQLVQGSVLAGQLQAISTAVRTGNPDPAPAADGGAAGGGQGWDAVLQQARVQTNRFLREIRGTPERPGVLISEIYVRRTALEDQLTAFLQSADPALILIGEAGVGKTTLLGQWTQDLLAGQHAVFFYDCGGSLRLEIEEEVAQDLALADAEQLPARLTQIGQLAGGAARQFLLIFDSIDEFHGDAQAGPAALLKRIDALVGRITAGPVRVVVSCNATVWRQLDRQGATQLFWSRYYPAHQEQSALPLDLFTPAEFAAAYAGYSRFFRLQTPLATLPAGPRESLRNPLLLRMLAEIYQGQAWPLSEDDLALSLYQHYYEERVRARPDQLFLAELVAEMRRQQRTTLALDDLAQNPQLRPAVVNEDPTSSYYQLLDKGILTEIPGNVTTGDMVKFTYTRVAAYALARALVRQPAGADGGLPALVQEAQAFPLIWDAARIVLLLRKDPVLFAQLAGATEIELRELVVESLAEFYAASPAPATDVIKQLLQMDSEEARRTGLKAAHLIGPQARDIFLWAASKGTTTLREAMRNTLYLIWHSDPTFVYDLLDEMSKRIGFGSFLALPSLLESLIELSITIYLNHPEREDVTNRTIDLYYDLATNRLHMDLVNNKILGPAFILFSQALATALIRPVLNTTLLSELQPAQNIFKLSPQDRAGLKRVALFLDPAVDPTPVMDDLVPLLTSEVLFFNIVGAHVLPIHAYRKFALMEPLVRTLYDKVDARGRLWILLSFGVLLPDTPPEWTPLLEEFTRRLLTEHPEVFYDDTLGILGQFDALLAPLGIAYGKQGSVMPYYVQLLREHLAQGDQPRLARCLAALAVVGFFYPEAVFETLRAAIPDFRDPAMQAILIAPLAIIRTLHFDAVDIFLQQIGADEHVQRQVSAAADVGLVRRYIYWVGVYNEVVHRCIFYPRMRRGISVAGLNLLADVPNEDAFISTFTAMMIRMFQDSGYRLGEWIKPD